MTDLAIVLFVLAAGCVGSSGSGVGHNTIAAPADNVAEVSVDYGLPSIGYVNGLFATVTVCVPGTSNCQNIDHVLVDTGSSGLRLLGSALTLSLPTLTDANGLTLAECGQFMSGFIWGPLRVADFTIAGEQASSLTVQVIDESAYPVPSDCASTGPDSDSAEVLGANGILGINSFLQDCGSACVATPGPQSLNPGQYYACSSANPGGCQVAAVPLAQQMTNPVALFSQDSNGTIIELPAISAEGAPQVAGSLVFGIGTRANNGLDQAAVLNLDDYGNFLTRYPTNGGLSYAFLDSGSNAIFFLDTSSTNIPTCFSISEPDISSFYCPASTLNLSARIQDAGGLVGVTVNFSIANAQALFANLNNVVYDNLGGPYSAPALGTGSSEASSVDYFDWGLPFHFGRNVFTAIEGQATSAGAGPFVAF